MVAPHRTPSLVQVETFSIAFPCLIHSRQTIEELSVEQRALCFAHGRTCLIPAVPYTCVVLLSTRCLFHFNRQGSCYKADSNLGGQGGGHGSEDHVLSSMVLKHPHIFFFFLNLSALLGHFSKTLPLLSFERHNIMAIRQLVQIS